MDNKIKDRLIEEVKRKIVDSIKKQFELGKIGLKDYRGIAFSPEGAKIIKAKKEYLNMYFTINRLFLRLDMLEQDMFEGERKFRSTAFPGMALLKVENKKVEVFKTLDYIYFGRLF